MYRKLWEQPNSNHKAGKNKTSLNKELRKKSRVLSADDLEKYAEKRVQWEMKLREGTPNEMSNVEYGERVNWLRQRKLQVELRQVLNVHSIFYVRFG